MDCCDHCQDTKDLFDNGKAKTELRKYRIGNCGNDLTSLSDDKTCYLHRLGT